MPPRILVVEDSWLQRTLISGVLRDAGVHVVEAENGDEAWAYLAAGFPIDLVFTDHQMPGSMLGAELAARVKAEHPTIDVVVVSGDWENVVWREPVLPKPYNPERTAAALMRRALAARPPE